MPIDIHAFNFIGARARYLIGSGALAIMIAQPAAVWAQTEGTPSAAAAAPSSGAQLEDIVVTAQRRGQNLQDVPLSVTAFNASTLAQSGITTVRELNQVDSALNINQSSGVVVPFLRGVGNPSGSTIGNEASVPIYIDDVYYSRLAPIDLELANIERVEVLKGPQGTLFGRNASGGAIQVFTRDPGDELEVAGKLGYANYQTYSGQLYIAAPITDTVGASISVSGSDQQDGWGKNLVTGQDTYRNKYINVRGKIVADLTPTTKVHLAGFYNWQRTGQGITNGLYEGRLNTDPQTGATIAPAGLYDAITTENNFIRHKGHGVSLKISQDIDFAELVSISAYRKSREFYLTDGEGLPVNFLRYELNARDRQISEELQLKSQAGSSFDWIIGGYYLNSRAGYLPTSVSGNAVSGQGFLAQELYGLQKVNSLSAYSQATFHVIPEGTNITLGLRYTADKVRGIGTQDLVLPGGAGVFPIPGTDYNRRFTFKKLTYKVALDHKFADDVMGYVSFSRGYKSGTFNTLPLSLDPSNPETVQAYEIGLKSELFDRRLRLNAAVFQNDVQNPQVQTVITTCDNSTPPICVNAVGLTNAEKAKIRGVEINADAILSDGLTLRAGLVYLDAKYTDFQNAPFYFPSPVAPFGNIGPIIGDATGNRLAQVPEWRFNGGINYKLVSSAGEFIFDVNAAYTDHYAWDADNILQQGSFTLVNSSITYRLPDNDRWSFSVWGKNITKEKYYITELTLAGGTGNIAAPAAPRTYGVEVGFKF